MKLYKKSLSALLLLPACSLAAEPLSMETLVVTANRSATPIKQLTSSATVIDSEALTLVAPVHIQEVMARVPGANIARGNGQEYLPALRSPVLTGAGGCGSVLSTVDGIPLRAAGFCNINELFEAPTELAQRIEVIRGPGNAFYGSNAMHGVINLLTPSVAENGTGHLSLEGGPHDYARLTASHNLQSGQQGFRADVMLSHDGGYRDDSGFDHQKLLLRHEYADDALSLSTSLLLTNLNQETAGYVNGTNAYRDSDLKDSNPNPEAYRDASALRLATRIAYSHNENLHWQITPYLRHAEMDFLQHFLPGDPLEENQQTSVGAQSAFYITLSDSLLLTTGIDMEFSKGSLKQSQPAPTQGSAFLQATIPQGKHYDYRVDALMAAAFAQTNWIVSEKLSVNAGLRFESMQYDYDNRMLTGRTQEDGTVCGFGGCRYSRPADRSDHFNNWSPQLGAIYQLDDNHQIFANLSHGFRAPQATELYRLQREQEVADLDSESLSSIEIGLRGEAQGLYYEVIAFAMRKKNVIFRDSDFFNVADGETHHHGLETALHVNLTEQWQLGLSATYAEHQYDDNRTLNGIAIDGNQVDSAPRFFSNLRLSWTPTQNTALEMEWLHQGSYYTDPENLHDYGGHDLLNLRGRWQLNKDIALSARLLNLTDEDYAERADYSSFSGDRYFPGEPRALYLGIDIHY
ncbi:TonB-dependent vitamin B12 receptor BtuB [Maricurvus nonylphenolicus]|uniref:TonB-dependent receptor n=1 Tax=Maricurvus nonylphenolicus TaxID=1008307 RepID=UPI0036F3C3E6